jgi:hypothetical protein
MRARTILGQRSVRENPRAPYDRRQLLAFRLTVPTAANRTARATTPAVDATGAGFGASQRVWPTHSGLPPQTEQLAAGCPPRVMHSAQLTSPVPHSTFPLPKSHAQQRFCGDGPPPQSVLPIHEGTLSQMLQLAAGWPPKPMQSTQLASGLPHSISPNPGTAVKSQAQHCWPAAGAGAAIRSTATVTNSTIQTRVIMRPSPQYPAADFAMTPVKLPAAAYRMVLTLRTWRRVTMAR